ncbi:MAG: preprotein translocase subunit SecE [Tissierellia bacterium]|nr:preprotein translocase subunit SecE [Tissierellia bacterium]
MAPKDNKTGFIKGVRSEWKKIIWPSKEDVLKNLLLVIVISLVLGVFIFALDSFFQFLLSLFI